MSVAVPALPAFTRAQCERIHGASLEILRRTGVRVHHPEALRLLKEAGALVEEESLVRLPAWLVEWALGQAPREVTLCYRGSAEPAVRLEGARVHFGPGSDCPNWLDPREGRRPCRRRDLAAAYRLVDGLPELDFLMSMGIPADVPARAYLVQFALMLSASRKPVVFVAEDGADCRAVAAMAAAAAGGAERLRLSPTVLLYSEPSTPLQHSATATEKLLFMAAQKLPVVHSPAPMMGGTAPLSLAGGLALGNAEVLSGLVIHQLRSPGSPFVYGSGLHHIDLKTSISVYGAPEFQLARWGVASLGGYYGLPTWGYAGHTDSPLFDGQAAADSAVSVLVALLTGTNLVHDVGYVEAGLTASPEMIVYTCEAIGMGRRFAAGISLAEEDLALEVIHRVGPGGNFLADDHTLEHFRQWWQPELLERRRHDHWRADGSRCLRERVKEKTLAALASSRGSPAGEALGREIASVLHDNGVPVDVSEG